MQSAVLGPRRPAVDARAEALLRPSRTQSAADRLDVYRRMVSARFESTLRAEFEAVAAFTGDDVFARLAAAFVRAAPSRAFTLARLADGFPEFVAAWPGLAPGRRAAVADLARLEQAVTRVALEPETAPVGVEALARVPADAWARAVLVPVPHFALETFRHDVVGVHDALLRGHVAPVRRRAVGALLVRRDGRVRRVALRPDEHAFLRDLVSATPLGEAVRRHPAVDAAAVLRRTFAVGLFAALDVG